MTTFYIKLRKNGQLYIPKKLGPVRIVWNLDGNYVYLTIIARKDLVYKRYHYPIPSHIVKQSFYRRVDSTILILFKEERRGHWTGRYKLMKGSKENVRNYGKARMDK
jgi:DNA-binding beta-propeller fold protein YncE